MPIIFGTVTHGWNRKLKMLSLPLYSLLSLSEMSEIVQNECNSKSLQKGVADLIGVNDSGELFKITEWLEGFHYPVGEKLFHNDFTDVFAINAPDGIEKQAPKDQHFIYCEYLPPGHH